MNRETATPEIQDHDALTTLKDKEMMDQQFALRLAEAIRKQASEALCREVTAEELWIEMGKWFLAPKKISFFLTGDSVKAQII